MVASCRNINIYIFSTFTVVLESEEPGITSVVC